MIKLIRLILKYTGIFRAANIKNKDDQLDCAKVIFIIAILSLIGLFLCLI